MRALLSKQLFESVFNICIACVLAAPFYCILINSKSTWTAETGILIQIRMTIKIYDSIDCFSGYSLSLRKSSSSFISSLLRYTA